MNKITPKMQEMLNGFLGVALWSSNVDELTIHDFEEGEVKEVIEVLTSFVCTLEGEQITQCANNPDQFGHCLALELAGHGSGFFDSEIDCVAKISDQLDNLPHYEAVYVVDGLPKIDFYTTGA